MMAKEKEKRKYKIFISFASPDSEYVNKIGQLLLSQHPDLQVYTNWSLSTGEEWQPELKRFLSECDFFLVLLSPQSVESKWILYELGAAWGLGKPIILVVTEPNVISRIPSPFNMYQWVKMKDLENPKIVKKLFEHYEPEPAMSR